VGILNTGWCTFNKGRRKLYDIYIDRCPIYIMYVLYPVYPDIGIGPII
jgi:hypothetical protein